MGDRRIRSALCALLAAAWAGAAPPAPASDGVPARKAPATAVPAQVPDVSVSVERGTIGHLTVVLRGGVGTRVSVTELATPSTPAVAIASLTLRQSVVRLRDAVAWSCTNLAPTVEAVVPSVEGGLQPQRASTPTPSCGRRLAVTLVPARVRVDYPVTVEISDRWKQGGLRVRACLGRASHCVTRTLRAGRASRMRLRPRSAGAGRITVSDAFEQVVERLTVRGGRPFLLATGDSEMQGLDDYLASDLSGAGGARVVGDARQSTALTSTFFFNWPAHAVQQVAGGRPDIVAMFLGGNEGFSIGGVACCGLAWSARYAGLVERMMSVYRQGGAAVVYWFLIPTPRDPAFVSLVAAVDRGIVLAARRLPQQVRTFDLRPTFSPGGRYLDSLDFHGQRLTVHESDGFHLSASADVIVAHLFIARLRLDGVLA